LDAFIEHLHYQAVNTADSADYVKLKDRLSDLRNDYKFESANTLFYLATPPSLYSVIPASLAEHGLNNEADGWKRLIVEKPFGYDLASARQLDKDIHEH
ncbi:glucose-6-phosphate dehydrogenase, partial [Vibrio campbellii]